MRRAVVAFLMMSIASFAMVGAAQAAKTYNDPWLEGDLQQIRVPGALDILARTPQHVIVGDIDSGARLTDPDLAPHLVSMPRPYTCEAVYAPGPDYSADPANGDFGCDFIGSGTEGSTTTSPDGDPTDPFGHGTGTAAIIAAVPDNGIEGAGVAPNARVLPVRACYGGNPDCAFDFGLPALTYAVAMGSSVINDAAPPENGYSAAFQSFIHDNPNVLFVFPISGSEQNASPYTLCTDRTTYPNVICVGLVNPNDTPGTVDGDTTTDVSAPGYAGVPSAAGARVEFGGTAGAAAHVAGAAALLRGVAPNLSASTIRQVLVATSRPVSGYLEANKAHGIIDVEAAVRAVQQMEGLTTPAAGQGAPADSPDPFPGQTTTGAGTTTAPASPSPPPPTVTKPTTAKPRLSILRKASAKVSAGSALEVRVQVSGGAANVAAILTHGKKTLAKATRHAVSGDVTLKLRLGRGAELGPAKLSLRLPGAKPLVEAVTVTKHH